MVQLWMLRSGTLEAGTFRHDVQFTRKFGLRTTGRHLQSQTWGSKQRLMLGGSNVRRHTNPQNNSSEVRGPCQ
jgi:hypothetical protein